MAKRRDDHAKLTGEVAALRQEKDGLTAAIAAVRDAGLTEVREVADAAVAEVQRAAAQFERISEQAAELGPHLRMARALASTDLAVWRTVAPETWAGLLGHLLRWAEVHAVATVDVVPPAAVLGRLEEQARYPHTKGPVRLTLPQLVGWVRACLEGASFRGTAALLAPSTADGVRPAG